MEIKPEVNEHYENPELTGEYKRVEKELKKAKHNRNMHFLGLSSAGVLSGITFSFIWNFISGPSGMAAGSIFLHPAILGTCVTTAFLGLGGLVVELENVKCVKPLKEKLLNLSGKLRANSKENHKEAIISHDIVRETNESVNEFLASKQREIHEKASERQAEVNHKIDIQKLASIPLNNPVNKFDPVQYEKEFEQDRLKHMEEQKRKLYATKKTLEAAAKTAGKSMEMDLQKNLYENDGQKLR